MDDSDGRSQPSRRRSVVPVGGGLPRPRAVRAGPHRLPPGDVLRPGHGLDVVGAGDESGVAGRRRRRPCFGVASSAPGAAEPGGARLRGEGASAVGPWLESRRQRPDAVWSAAKPLEPLLGANGHGRRRGDGGPRLHRPALPARRRLGLGHQQIPRTLRGGEGVGEALRFDLPGLLPGPEWPLALDQGKGQSLQLQQLAHLLGQGECRALRSQGRLAGPGRLEQLGRGPRTAGRDSVAIKAGGHAS